jgi:demethylmenaquinone methyltransferase/2-methoxy-6-polyprenyl-1,4-benzoquinol methylase
MAPMDKDFPLKEFYSDIYRSYDRVNRIFTFGRDSSWRKKAAQVILRENPENILDVCTGTGDFILEIGQQLSKEGRTAVLKGYDFSREMLDVAREKQKGANAFPGASDIEFLQGDVGDMPYGNDSFDVIGITFGIRNLVYENSRASRHLAELFRVIRPGGRLVILESSRPENSVWRLFNNIYLRFILPYLGGLISGNIKAYSYLGKSSRNYYTAGEMGDILTSAGFKVLSSRYFFLGSVMLVEARKER